MKKYLKLWSKTVHCLKLNSVIFKVKVILTSSVIVVVIWSARECWHSPALAAGASQDRCMCRYGSQKGCKNNTKSTWWLGYILITSYVYTLHFFNFVFRFHAVTFAINPFLRMCQEIHPNSGKKTGDAMIGECAFNIQWYHINFPHILFPMISMISHYINIALPTLGSATGIPWQCPTLFSTPGLGNGEEEQIQIRYGRRSLKSTPLPDRTYPGQNPQKLLLLQRRLFQRRSQQP